MKSGDIVLFVWLLVLCGCVVSACNEAVCASVASKCMLTGACKCDMTRLSECTCCKECALCLDKLYAECCYCFKMCPKPQRSWTDLAMHSDVETYDEPQADLFAILTEDKDILERWLSYTFPVEHQINSAKHNKKYKIKLVAVDDAGDEVVTPSVGGVSAEPPVSLNCTVAYLSQCRSWGKCSSACRSMGASAFRWFHNGCCECIGDTCINFGIDESRCLRCSENEEERTSDATMDAALAAAYEDDHSITISRRKHGASPSVNSLPAKPTIAEEISNELGPGSVGISPGG